ncbi:MAG: hypothetical protein JJ957_08405 [Pseudomonadales bacterium]|nr:hypothetical protein [Pseudomonadales bacterium]MBO6596487.1 hypothetical protein [Pseudomonadales bacterium]MBO6822967.1 hypothetical protein [Pseudomonadales bacterium]
MSVFNRYQVDLPSGRIEQLFLATNVNVARNPDVRNQILEGTFQSHPEGRLIRPFLYVDSERDSLFFVLPKTQKHLWTYASEQIELAASHFSKAGISESAQLRVVFGLDALREKLIIQDQSIVDDRQIELIKVLCLSDHPFLLNNPRLNFLVDQINEDEIQLIAHFDHGPEVFQLKMNWIDIQDAVENQFETWIQNSHKQNFFELDSDYWISLERWAPRNTALRTLYQYSKALAENHDIDHDTTEFEFMVEYLPRGDHLPRYAKRQLRLLSTYFGQRSLTSVQDQLFEIRFSTSLEDDWALTNDPKNIDTLWDLLRKLPDSNVDGNIYISAYNLNLGERGGSYHTETNEISIGELTLDDPDEFANIVRHEVGHAVHEKFPNQINGLLEQVFGWRTFKSTNAGIDAWIALMGGWGELTEKEKRQIRTTIRQVIGDTAWEYTEVNLPASHPWNSQNLHARKAFDQCIGPEDYWWKNYQSWYRSGNLAFSFNFYYKNDYYKNLGPLMCINVETIELIEKLPSNYAAMSPSEFFAELYAIYYDTERDISYLSSEITDWFAETLGERGPQTS